MTEEKKFVTRDLTLAATLITLKFPLTGIDYQVEGERQRPVGYFNFKETEELLKATRLFMQRGLSVEPREMADNLRGLKAQLANEYKSPHSKYNKE